MCDGLAQWLKMAGVQGTEILSFASPQDCCMSNGNRVFVLYKAAMKSSETTDKNDLYTRFLVRQYSILIYISYPTSPLLSFPSQLPLIWHILWSPDSENKSQLAPASWGAKYFLNKVPEVIKSLGKTSKYLHCLQNQWNVSLHPGQMTYQGTQSCQK